VKGVIVDTNSIHKLFNSDGVGSKIWELLKCRELQIPGGGTKYKEEILRSPLVAFFQELARSGIIKLYKDEEIDALEDRYKNHAEVTSDDEHVIAIADRSGCRLLFSADKALTSDFKNPKIINRPRGKVINSRYYAQIVNNAPACRS
jgi:hypothetical protein